MSPSHPFESESAAGLALAFSPDCILLDLKVPGADCQEICREIRKWSDVPIIALTSANDKFTEVMCINLGAHDLIAEPYHPAALLAVHLLTLTIDSLGRYRMLSGIGCDGRMLNRSLFVQALAYFLLPLVLAVCHSAWTINVMSDSLFKAFGSNLIPSILMSVALIFGEGQNTGQLELSAVEDLAGCLNIAGHINFL